MNSLASNEGDDELKRKKRQERLESNRISARESRKRKKTMIEELQKTVIVLSRENKELNERNEALRRQLIEVGTKVRVSKQFHTYFLYIYFFSRRSSSSYHTMNVLP